MDIFGPQSYMTVAILGLDQCLRNLQFPCRWVMDLGGMYGYPLFNVYAPLPYYFGVVIYFFSQNLSFAAKVMFSFSFLGSFLFAYLFLSKFWKGTRIVVTALFYSLAATYISLNTGSNAAGLMWFLMFIPAIFWVSFRLSHSTRVVNVLILVVLISFSILSHQIGIFFSLAILLIYLINFVCNGKKVRLIKFYLVALMLGILLAAFYWLPMLAEKNFVTINQLPPFNKRLPTKLDLVRHEVIAGETKIFNFQEKVNVIIFETDTSSHSIIRLAEYYFPGWEISVDGQKAGMDYKNSLGLMTFILGKGKHRVELRLKDTPIRIVSHILTIIGLIISLILVATQFPKTRHWILYYLRSFYK